MAGSIFGKEFAARLEAQNKAQRKARQIEASAVAKVASLNRQIATLQEDAKGSLQDVVATQSAGNADMKATILKKRLALQEKDDSASSAQGAKGPSVADQIPKASASRISAQGVPQLNDAPAGAERAAELIRQSVSGGAAVQQAAAEGGAGGPGGGQPGTGGFGNPGVQIPSAPGRVTDVSVSGGGRLLETSPGRFRGVPNTQFQINNRSNALTPGQVLQAQISERGRQDSQQQQQLQNAFNAANELGKFGAPYIAAVLSGNTEEQTRILGEAGGTATNRALKKAGEASDAAAELARQRGLSLAFERGLQEQFIKAQFSTAKGIGNVLAIGSMFPDEAPGVGIGGLGRFPTMANILGGTQPRITALEKAYLDALDNGGELNRDKKIDPNRARIMQEYQAKNANTFLYFKGEGFGGGRFRSSQVSFDQIRNAIVTLSVQKDKPAMLKAKELLGDIPGVTVRVDSVGRLRMTVSPETLGGDSIQSTLNKRVATWMKAMMGSMKQGTKEFNVDLMQGLPFLSQDQVDRYFTQQRIFIQRKKVAAEGSASKRKVIFDAIKAFGESAAEASGTRRFPIGRPVNSGGVSRPGRGPQSREPVQLPPPPSPPIDGSQLQSPAVTPGTGINTALQTIQRINAERAAKGLPPLFTPSQ